MRFLKVYDTVQHSVAPVNWYFPGALRLFPQLHRFGILVTGRAPQLEERRSRGWEDANPTAHCNLGMKNGCASGAPRLFSSILVVL